MAISANTLFHFTDSLDKLISILKHKFRPCYHDEKSLLSELLLDVHTLKALKLSIGWVIPMVCFCDLPLSMVSRHMRYYGSYALGMSKNWGIRKGLNPVLYLCGNSDLAHALGIFHKKSYKKSRRVEAYMKPYEHSGKRYYDEREWRYVPNPRNAKNLWITPDIYTNKKKLDCANQLMGDRFKLSFAPSDIRYIVIKSEAERLPLIRAIGEIKYKHSKSIIMKLSSRILSSRQIREDL